MRGMIQNAPIGVFAVMVLLPLAMAGICVFAGLRARRQAQLVKSTKSTAIGMAEDGYLQFEGTAEAVGGQTVRAPLTGSECVWFEARVEEYISRRRSSSERSDWQVVKSFASASPFLVRDATGVCVVRIDGAEVTPRDKSRWTGATLEPEDRNPPRLGMQESWPMVETAGGTSSRFRYHETRIYPGDPLTVVGQFASHRFDAADDEDDLEELPPDPSIAPGWKADETDAADDAENDAEDDGDADVADALDDRARAITKAEIMTGGRGKPLIVAASTASTHAYMSEMGAQAAFMVALVPLGVAGLVLLARFG